MPFQLMLFTALMAMLLLNNQGYLNSIETDQANRLVGFLNRLNPIFQRKVQVSTKIEVSICVKNVVQAQIGKHGWMQTCPSFLFFSDKTANYHIIVDMRKQHLPWMIGVFGIFGTVYGTYLLIYHYSHGNGLSVPALILLILGVPALLFSIALAISIRLAERKKARSPSISPMVTEESKEKEDTPRLEEKKEEPAPSPKEAEPEPKAEREERAVETPSPHRSYYSSSSSSYASTAYVKLVGYGPVLRVEGNRIVDMRTNTYYRIEGNVVNQEGYGIRYEIRGNQIRDAFGGYLYELSGSNINKVYGGFYASISGNYITLFDLSQKYEMTDSLSKKQILVAAALLFGAY